jgi:hypothetical protein
VTKTESKDYKIVFDKRIITADLNTIPYGYWFHCIIKYL